MAAGSTQHASDASQERRQAAGRAHVRARMRAAKHWGFAGAEAAPSPAMPSRSVSPVTLLMTASSLTPQALPASSERARSESARASWLLAAAGRLLLLPAISPSTLERASRRGVLCSSCAQTFSCAVVEAAELAFGTNFVTLLVPRSPQLTTDGQCGDTPEGVWQEQRAAGETVHQAGPER